MTPQPTPLPSRCVSAWGSGWGFPWREGPSLVGVGLASSEGPGDEAKRQSWGREASWCPCRPRLAAGQQAARSRPAPTRPQLPWNGPCALTSQKKAHGPLPGPSPDAPPACTSLLAENTAFCHSGRFRSCNKIAEGPRTGQLTKSFCDRSACGWGTGLSEEATAISREHRGLSSRPTH